jgi:hypothetical protein
MWWNVAPLVNEVDFYLNSYHDSCARISQVKIYVGQFVIWFQGVRGLRRCVPFDHNLGVSQNSLVDVLMICDYYYVWNLKWKPMCLFMHASIIALNLGAIIAVVNGQAWNKATT